MTATTNHALHRHDFQAMASPIEVMTPSVEGTLAFSHIEQEFRDSEQALSRFRETSDLSLLNHNLGHFEAVSDRLYEAISLAYRAYRVSHGIFDPRVILALEQSGYHGAPLDTSSLQVDAKNTEEWLQRCPRERSVTLHHPIDLGGIGKGLTVRRAAKMMHSHTSNYLINAGGDIAISGLGPDGACWSVGIESPYEKEALALAVTTPGTQIAICTSSVKNNHWLHGSDKMHHLIDPTTGKPGGAGLVAVTVWGKDPMWSEIFSKVIFLHGAEEARFIAKSLDLAAWWFYEDEMLGMTQAAMQKLTWLSDKIGVREII